MRLLPKIQWGVYGGLKECPYFRKWVLDFGWRTIRLHRWYGDDDHRWPHDHPYWFKTMVLWGGYDDVEYDLFEGEEPDQPLLMVKRVQHMKRWRFYYRPAEHLHAVRNVKPNTWTLLITGKPSRRWGFQVGHKKIQRDKYFAVYGHHPCDPKEPAVRLKPDGSRIDG
ncbi:hypothetical protein EVC30_107 [Rhizobium phage RHph_Y1_11]|nr:hypothetical protein EVC30_107 [Rhizobium phage RHph_Y1_11]